MREALAYLLAITIAEIITVSLQPVWGIVGHITILVAAILHSALASKPAQQKLLLSLALVPLIRIISLSMPLADIPPMWRYPIIYAPLLAAAIVVARISALKAEDIGLRVRALPFQLAVALSGFVFGIAEYLILKPEPAIAMLTWQTVWLPALIFLTSTGFVEEFMFRGVMQRTALEAFGWRGIIYISLLFAIVHVIHQSAIDLVFVFVIAVFFAWVVKRTGSLLGVTLSHGITNIMLYLVIPFFL